MFHYKKTVMLLLGAVLSFHIMAWPAAIKWADDNAGTGNRKTVPATVDSTSVSVPRCDVGLNYDGFGEFTEDPYCHRYGLIWRPALVANGNEFIMDKQIDWAPGLTATNDSDFRLPTIKELIRLVDYDFTDSQGDYDESKGGFTDPLIEYWLKNKCQANTLGSNDCSSQSVTIDNREAQVDRDGYLISSTYANVDGDVTGASSSHSTVYGIRIKDGHVVLMESGGKGGVFRHHPDKQGMLALCPGLLTDNTNTIVTGHCDYQVNDQPDSGSADTEGAEYSVVAVYALLVKEL